VKRLKPIPQALQVLTEFGFRAPKTEEELYWVVDEPDVSKMEAGVNDLNVLINHMAPNTPIAVATLKLTENNGKPTMAKLVEKVQSCLHKIITQPKEPKFQRVNVDKFFSHIGPVDGGKDFLGLFGFQLDDSAEFAQIPAQSFDLELIQLRSRELHRAWKAALATLRGRAAAKSSNAMTDI